MPVQQVESRSQHVVQFYDHDQHLLVKNVSRFLGEGLERGEGALVIATPGHIPAFRAQLKADGYDADAAVREGRLVLRDADATLASIMIDGHPDAERVHRVIGGLVRKVRSQTGNDGIRVYGEMVALLWNAGQYGAAIRLEECWNELVHATGLNLFCAYQIDVFGTEFQGAFLDGLLCAHTHVLPGGTDGALENAVLRATREVLGYEPEGVREHRKSDTQPRWAAMTDGEATVLWLRNALPAYADEILERARRYYLALPA